MNRESVDRAPSGDPGPFGVRREIESLGPWFHNLHLPGGVETAPDHWLGDFPRFKWIELAPCLPEDLHGWTALDVGCNAGFYSFELARRGARVVGIDLDARYLRQARWAAAKLDLAGRVEFRRMQVYDLARSGEKYDLVLFMGVLYHLRYPLLGLDAVARATGRLLVLQTLMTPGDQERHADNLQLHQREPMEHAGWPKLAFVEGRFQNDPTNWWIPNHACVQAMARSAGLEILSRPASETYLCAPDPAATRHLEWLAEEFDAATGRMRPGSRPPDADP